ncbi:glycoside hydrolase family 3 protein [Qipengyuania marisflavi]|uniref:Glycoside hydrolase family 3 protein n=1 Tax=Qipengyuania marisflavi TaxID=2486356 RepID=A0A5S3P0S5_9SPHN|nr:glycoside hydrolase family 3 protein [Qipengyuania marisflavi]TMM46251.1 glycoside hydrolase family 3 protein [Qipengyuania marisflavi]
MNVRLWLSVATIALGGCATLPAPVADTSAPVLVADAGAAAANVAAWPQARSPSAITDPATEAAIGALIARMTLEQKVGQLIQADISAITPADLERYPLGSLLAGGNSGPYGDERGSAADWDRMVREFRAVSARPGADGVSIPLLFGVDAVHGHNNIPGATLFPHNVGLGAARDSDLIRRIGAVTAAEIAGSGIEWTFAPTLAVPQDLRWGRAYEGYSSDPAIVADYSRAMVDGLQGTLVAGQQLANTKVAATAKHFLADGGTEKGQDQGDAQISEAELVRIHAAGYPPAIDAGVLTVMASFSSWNGIKNHGNRTLLTEVLKDRMGFAGLVVGDWNGHGQIAGCSNTDCPQSINAGLDLFMAPDSWKPLYESTLAHARSGAIPMTRVEDAVRRILRVKYKLGLMDGQPNDRGNHAVVGAPEHLAVAREAVAKSLVLLKNAGSVLPIKPGAKVMVTGPGADSMAMQSGGWTVSWQGTDVTREDFPNGQTIWEGLRDAVGEAGGTASLSTDGSITQRPDVAIVVFGETPYAEFQGDVPHLDFTGDGETQIAALKAQGIPVVAVFLSGRPMFVGPELTAADAFVAAWLPGSQGAGVADVLVAGKTGTSPRDFTGALSFAWPAGCEPDAATLFPLGFGGNYAAAPTVPMLTTECALSAAGADGGLALYDRGLEAGIEAIAAGTVFPNLAGRVQNLTVAGFDVAAQEDARRFTWTGPASLALGWTAQPLPATGALELQYQVADAPRAPVTLAAADSNAKGTVDLTASLALAAGKGWRTMQVPLACLTDDSQLDGIALASDSAFVFDMVSMRIVAQANETDCTGPF